MVGKILKAISEESFFADNFIFFNHILFRRGFDTRAKKFFAYFMRNSRSCSWSHFLPDNIFSCYQDADIEQWKKNVLDSSYYLCPDDRQSYLRFTTVCIYKKTNP